MTHEQALNRASELWPETDEHGQLYRTAYMQCWEDMQGGEQTWSDEDMREAFDVFRYEHFPHNEPDFDEWLEQYKQSKNP